MQFLKTNFLHSSKTFNVLLITIAILVTPVSFCLAGEKEELAAAKALIAIIESGNAGQIKQAETLFASIPANSSLKPIAAYALAVLQLP